MSMITVITLTNSFLSCSILLQLFVLDFPDYDGEELNQISGLLARDYGYNYPPEARYATILYAMLHCITMRYITQRCTILRYTTLQHATLYHTTMLCTILSYTAIYSATLKCFCFVLTVFYCIYCVSSKCLLWGSLD